MPHTRYISQFQFQSLHTYIHYCFAAHGLPLLGFCSPVPTRFCLCMQVGRSTLFYFSYSKSQIKEFGYVTNISTSYSFFQNQIIPLARSIYYAGPSTYYDLPQFPFFHSDFLFLCQTLKSLLWVFPYFGTARVI